MNRNAKLVIFVFVSLVNINYGNANVEDSKVEEADMDFKQLAKKYGRQCEVYNITTEDGYVLQLHRLVGDKNKPVLLWHGILDCSDAFILRGFNSTSLVLNEKGYDVWLGNSRGNKYSRKHITLDPDKDIKKFWDFSMHEMGYYDLASTIDFILNKTGQDKLSAIGHSLGTTIFYVLASTRPEYNEKINVFISMAPIAYLSHMRHLIGFLLPAWPLVSASFAALGQDELLGNHSFLHQLMQLLCTKSNLAYDVCVKGLVMSVVGNDPDELDKPFFDMALKHFPSGASRKTVDHFAQIALRKRFANFDYGIFGNLAKYGQIKAPKYNLKNVTASVALLVADNDNIANIEDVEQLKAELYNVVSYKVLDRKKMNHADFIWGKNINTYLNPTLIKLLS